MDYRGIVIERDLVSSGWSFVDPSTKFRISSTELDLLFHEIDATLKDAPDGAD